MPNVISGFLKSPANPSANRQSEYTDLGEYIYALDPYLAVPPPYWAWEVAHAPAIVDIEIDPAKQGILFLLDTAGIEHHENPGNWRFKNAEHIVHRALRIPYMYYKRNEHNEKQGVLVRDYFMIGFEGGIGFNQA